MTDPAALLRVIALVEQATEGSALLDSRIAFATGHFVMNKNASSLGVREGDVVNWIIFKDVMYHWKPFTEEEAIRDMAQILSLPAYTRSLDAALTLLELDQRINQVQDRTYCGDGWLVSIDRWKKEPAAPGYASYSFRGDGYGWRAPTFALALTLACLRARLAESER